MGIAYAVKAKGNARPMSKFYVNVYYLYKGRAYKVRSFSQGYYGPGFRLKSLGSFSKRGMYATTITFVPKKGSVYKSSSSGPRYFYVK